MTQLGTRARRAWVAGSFLAAAAVHVAAPAGPHSWHVLHLVAQKLCYVPIVLAAGWLGSRATVAVTAAVSAVVVAHVTRDWAALFYRINVARIDLPPLRERKADIPLLVERFVERFAAEMGKVGVTVDPGEPPGRDVHISDRENARSDMRHRHARTG